MSFQEINGLTLPSLFACFRALYSSGSVPLKTTCTETRAINGTLGKLSYKSCWLLATEIYNHQIQFLMDVEFKAHQVHILWLSSTDCCAWSRSSHRVDLCKDCKGIYIYIYYRKHWENMFLFPGSLTFLGSGMEPSPTSSDVKVSASSGQCAMGSDPQNSEPAASAHLWTMRKFECQSNESESYSSVNLCEE